MTVVEMPSSAMPSGTPAADRWQGERWLGGRFRLDERISSGDQVSGSLDPRGSSREARGFSLWKASDQLLGRPVSIYLLPPGAPVPRPVVEAVQSAAKVSDPRLAAIYDTDFQPDQAAAPRGVTHGGHARCRSSSARASASARSVPAFSVARSDSSVTSMRAIGPHPGVSRLRTRSWPSASSSVGSRGPVFFPISNS
jgi:hypothetical protein